MHVLLMTLLLALANASLATFAKENVPFLAILLVIYICILLYIHSSALYFVFPVVAKQCSCQIWVFVVHKSCTNEIASCSADFTVAHCFCSQKCIEVSIFYAAFYFLWKCRHYYCSVYSCVIMFYRMLF